MNLLIIIFLLIIQYNFNVWVLDNHTITDIGVENVKSEISK